MEHQITDTNAPAIYADPEGRLFIQGQFFDFNSKYKDSYPETHFTCGIRAGDGYAAAGMAADGHPVLFRSVLGNEWTETPLISGEEDGYKKAEGTIIAIDYDSASRRLFLISDHNELIIIPNCRKCIRIIEL
ncbi:MAG: hypothetical protein K6C99_00830 [Lachnospiraceae bacterium]|nr:hypothetical protein [Lachnospiraceae bacterium]